MFKLALCNTSCRRHQAYGRGFGHAVAHLWIYCNVNLFFYRTGRKKLPVYSPVERALPYHFGPDPKLGLVDFTQVHHPIRAMAGPTSVKAGYGPCADHPNAHSPSEVALPALWVSSTIFLGPGTSLFPQRSLLTLEYPPTRKTNKQTIGTRECPRATVPRSDNDTPERHSKATSQKP